MSHYEKHPTKSFFILILLESLILSSCNRMQVVYYTSDNITFRNNDSWIDMSVVNIDSTMMADESKKTAILYGKISERLYSTSSEITPCRVFIPQNNIDFEVTENIFEAELTEGSYDILVYNRSGEAISRHLYLHGGKKYFLHCIMGRKAVVCSSHSLVTDTFSMKYFGTTQFFFNDTDTISLGGSILNESRFDKSIPPKYGKVSFDVFQKGRTTCSKDRKRVNAKMFIPAKLMTKELTKENHDVLLPCGSYTIYIASEGFSVQKVIVYIQEGQCIKLDVFLGFNTLN